MGQQLLSAPPASGGPTPPPPPAGTRSAWPPPPPSGQQPGPRDPQLSDTMERMLRPQGLFQRPQPKQYDWNSQWTPGAATASTGPTPVTAPAPTGPPSGGGPWQGQSPTPPPGGPTPPNPGQYPAAGGQYPPGTPYQTGAIAPAVGAAPPPPGYPANGGQVPPGGAPTTADRYGLGQGQHGPGGPFSGGQPGQLPPGQYPPGQYGQTTYPPGQYGAAQFGQGQVAPGQYGVDQYGATQFVPTAYQDGQYGPGATPSGPYGPGGQYPPSGQYGSGGQYGPDGSPADGQKRPLTFGKITLPRGPLIPAIAAAALVVIVVIAVVLSLGGSPSSTPGKSAAATGGGTTPKATSSSSGQSPTERLAAKQLSGLLAQSGSDHAAVTDAVLNVRSCGKNLGANAQTFAKSAADRTSLLAKLAALPGRSSLPSAMVTDLTGAWQASASVDKDLSKWASHAATAGCHGGDLAYPSYTASLNDDGVATSDKRAFVSLWNPLAQKDSLPTYQSAQL
jgi:hypothetical protein